MISDIIMSIRFACYCQRLGFFLTRRYLNIVLCGLNDMFVQSLSEFQRTMAHLLVIYISPFSSAHPFLFPFLTSFHLDVSHFICTFRLFLFIYLITVTFCFVCNFLATFLFPICCQSHTRNQSHRRTSADAFGRHYYIP